MPGQHPCSGHQPRHATRTLILGAAALTLAVAGCSTTSTTTRPSATVSATPAAAGPTVRLNGAGSTFDAPFFSLAFARYHQQNSSVSVGYAAVGSSAGIAAFSAGQVSFGASDVPMTASQQAAAHGGTPLQVPVDLGAVVVAYNVLLPGAGHLRLTGPVIAQIFMGQITRWNAPAIASLNPGVVLPADPITVIHRSDGSGTTYIFSNYLSSVDKAWANRLGASTTIRWLVGLGAKGNPGVATAIARTPFSIGYIERSYSRGPRLNFAAVRNREGDFTIPTATAIAADAAQKPDVSAADFSIVNEPGTQSYPISGYSWVLVYRDQSSLSTGRALVALLNWLTHSGQAYAAQDDYVPLPTRIQQLARTTLSRVTGPGGQPLLG
jgi:phosphate transport system substrate-binding protein